MNKEIQRLDPDRLEFLSCQAKWLALNKPGGILTQAPPGIDSIELRVFRWRQSQVASGPPNAGAEASPYVGVPHRLDRPVSGAILIGLTKSYTRKIAVLFQRREVSKYYWAVVEGEVHDEAGSWSDFMRKIPDQAKSELVPENHPDSQIAVLNYRVLGRAAGNSWLRIELETGRTHQIRLQCASRGHPVLGDSLYGANSSFGPVTMDERDRWIALHARFLRLIVPGASERAAISAPLFSTWDVFREQFPAMWNAEY